MKQPDAALTGKHRQTRAAPPHLAPAPHASDRPRVVIIGAAADLLRTLTHPLMEAGRFAAVATYRVEVESGLSNEARTEVEGMFDRFEADGIVLAGPVGPELSAWVNDLALAHDRDVWAVMSTEVPPHAHPVVFGHGRTALLLITGRRRSPVALAVKRGVDIIGSLVAILIAAPIVAVLAVLIWLESPGAPVFRHTRIGCSGRRFGCLKLRTMFHDAEDRLSTDSALFAIYRDGGYKIEERYDPRVTRLGKLLRRASLDELPQFWNVLVGEMSLVGPRPVVPMELEEYSGAQRRLLLSMSPGITGAWAVNGRHSVSYPDRADIELSYIRSWTLGADAWILVRTFRAILTY